VTVVGLVFQVSSEVSVQCHGRVPVLDTVSQQGYRPMQDRPLDQMPLRELFSHAEHQARDLADHLDLNFLTKLQKRWAISRYAAERLKCWKAMILPGNC
jgi:hypothetical protein